jgi:hypothetical protein
MASQSTEQRKSTEPINARDATPSAALKRIGEALVGTWKLSGGPEGTIRYQWTEGGRFLIQHVDLKAFGRQIKGIEVIGQLHRVGEQPSEDVWTRFYSFLDGLTLDSVYELNGKKLTQLDKNRLDPLCPA